MILKEDITVWVRGRDRPTGCSLLHAMQAPCWCIRTTDASIVSTAPSLATAGASVFWFQIHAFGAIADMAERTLRANSRPEQVQQRA